MRISEEFPRPAQAECRHVGLLAEQEARLAAWWDQSGNVTMGGGAHDITPRQHPTLS